MSLGLLLSLGMARQHHTVPLCVRRSEYFVPHKQFMKYLESAPVTLCSKTQLSHRITGVAVILLAKGSNGGGKLHIESVCVFQTCLLFSVVIVLQICPNILLPGIGFATEERVHAGWGGRCFSYTAAPEQPSLC